MTSKDTDVVSSTRGKSLAAAELTAATAALAAAGPADKPAAFKRFNRAQEAKIQADRRAAALGG